MVRKNVDLRQEEILDATVARIESDGLQSLRIADVARDLGVSPALLIYHFQTKDMLVAAAFRHAAQADMATMRETAEGSGDPLTRLWNALRWYAPTGRAYGWRLWVEGWAGALQDEHLKAVLDELDSEWQDLIVGLIKESSKAGEVKVANARVAYDRITTAIDGMAVALLRGRLSSRKLNDWMRELVARELGVSEAKLKTSRGSR